MRRHSRYRRLRAGGGVYLFFTTFNLFWACHCRQNVAKIIVLHTIPSCLLVRLCCMYRCCPGSNLVYHSVTRSVLRRRRSYLKTWAWLPPSCSSCSSLLRSSSPKRERLYGHYRNTRRTRWLDQQCSAVVMKPFSYQGPLFICHLMRFSLSHPKLRLGCRTWIAFCPQVHAVLMLVP